MANGEAMKGWRIAIISAVLPVVQPLVSHLRELGHEPVAWLMPRRTEGDDRPLPPWGAVTDGSAPEGINLLFARDKWGGRASAARARARPRWASSVFDQLAPEENIDFTTGDSRYYSYEQMFFREVLAK